MHNHNRSTVGLALSFLIMLMPIAAQAQRIPTITAPEAATLRARPDSLDAVIMALNVQINLRVPVGLSVAATANWNEQTAWLTRARDRYVAYAKDARATFGNARLSDDAMVQKMAAMNMQFLALQEATQAESRKFQTLSSALKTRHDIALNAIRNMK